MNEIIWKTIGKSETDAQLYVSIDCYEAEPEVGIDFPSFEITDVSVLAYGGYKSKGGDDSLTRLSEGLLNLAQTDAEFGQELIEAVLEKNEQY